MLLSAAAILAILAMLLFRVKELPPHHQDPHSAQILAIPHLVAKMLCVQIVVEQLPATVSRITLVTHM